MYATAPAPNTSALNHAMSGRVVPPVGAGDDELGAGADPLFEEAPEAVDAGDDELGAGADPLFEEAPEAVDAGFVPVPDTLPVGLTALALPLEPVFPVEFVVPEGPSPLKSSRPAAVTVPVGPGEFR